MTLMYQCNMEHKGSEYEFYVEKKIIFAVTPFDVL